MRTVFELPGGAPNLGVAGWNETDAGRAMLDLAARGEKRAGRANDVRLAC
jgi:hypothetical protein